MMYVEMKLLNFTFVTFFIRPVIEGALGLPREIVSGVDLTIFPLVHPWPQLLSWEGGHGSRVEIFSVSVPIYNCNITCIVYYNCYFSITSVHNEYAFNYEYTNVLL